MKKMILALLIGLTLHFIALPAVGDEAVPQKIAHVDGVIDDFARQFFFNELEATKDLPGDRVIYINSPGGYVDIGMDMINAMEAEKDHGVKQVCIVTHLAASMAFNFLSHCDVRIADTGAVLLFHKIAIGSIPAGMRLTAKNLKEIAAYIEKADGPLAEYNAAALKMSSAEYDFYADRDTFWMPETLVKLGYLNSIGNYADKF